MTGKWMSDATFVTEINQLAWVISPSDPDVMLPLLTRFHEGTNTADDAQNPLFQTASLAYVVWCRMNHNCTVAAVRYEMERKRQALMPFPWDNEE